MQRPTHLRRWNAALALACACAWATAIASAPAASSSVVVTMDVPSATTIDATLCTTGMPGRTDFGVVQPGTSAVTSLPCSVQFGSSNDTASLRIKQLDGLGTAMHGYTDGSSDLAFGGATPGRVVHGGAGDQKAIAIAVDPKGRLWSSTRSSGVAVIRRYLPDGTIDDSWNTTGSMSINPSANNDEVRGFAFPSDDRVVLLMSTARNTSGDTQLYAFDESGTTDTSFGTGGVTSLDLAGGGLADDPNSIHVLDDGSLAVVVEPGLNGSTRRVGVARFTPDGQLDTDWASGGLALTNVPTLTAGPLHANGRPGPDGTFTIAGRTYNGSDWDSFVVRIQPDGTPGALTSWDASGEGSNDEARDAAQLPGGDLLVIGHLIDSTVWHGYASRRTSAGAPVTGFGTAGILRVAGTSALRSLELDAIGRAWIAGRTDTIGSEDVAMLHLNATNMAIDQTFAGTGMATLSFGSTYDYVPLPGLLKFGEDGSAYVSFESAGANDDALVARFTAAPFDDYADGSTDWDLGDRMFGACLDSVATGGAATWTPLAGCAEGDDPGWQAIPDATASTVATSPSGDDDATANLHFGIRTADDQAPGLYVAPIELQVVAPAA